MRRILSRGFGGIRTATVTLVAIALIGTMIPLTATIVSAKGETAAQWNLNGATVLSKANTGSATDQALWQKDSGGVAIPSGIPKAGSAGVLAQGYLDAGGPYVGNEGDTITFIATDTGAPSPLVFIRWDFESDGKWDKTPSYDPVFGWSMDWTVAWTIADDLYGDLVKVEAWDGISPTTEIDTAFIDVSNVAPSVSNVAVSPAIGQEGSEVSMTGMFTDPGVRDSWWYRANWGDGTFSNWTKVDKWEPTKKIRVLFLHTLALGNGYQIMKDALTAACGSDCETVDMWEFGQDPPYAYNRLPTLAEALQYDVIVVASNTCQWYTRGRVLAGNLLADYADQGRGVVAMEASFYPISGSCGAGIGTLSRWYNQGYTPLGTSYLTPYGPTRYLGQVYDSTHYLMDGVNNVKAYMIHSITDVRPGAVRIADWETGEVMVATKVNPIVPNDARVVALNFFPGPYTKISYGAALDWDRLWHNSVLWAAHAVREKTLPIQLGNLTRVYGDDYLYPATMEVRDDDGGVGEGPVPIDVRNVNPEVVGNVVTSANTTIYPFDTVSFYGSATDQGSDDLTFTWDFGDGNVVTSPTHYNDGIGPDPYPSPAGNFPFSANESVDHIYSLGGDLVITLTARDDDGGASSTQMRIHITSPQDMKNEAIQRIKALKELALARGDKHLLHELDEAENEVWESLGYEHPFKPETVSVDLAPDVTVKKEGHDKVELVLGPSWNAKLSTYTRLNLTWANGVVTTIDLPKGWPGKPKGWPTRDVHAHEKVWVDAWHQDVDIHSKWDKKTGRLTLTVHAHDASLGFSISLDSDKVASLSFTYKIRPWWIDVSHLDPKHGKHVFDEEKDAVKDLMHRGKIHWNVTIVCKLKERMWTPAERAALNEECDAIANILVRADEMLARIALSQAMETLIKNPKHIKEVQHEIEKAEKELAKAYKDWGKMDYGHAIDHFKHAWEHSQHAIKHAMKK